jgi:hypothetical protein
VESFKGAGSPLIKFREADNEIILRIRDHQQPKRRSTSK